MDDSGIIALYFARNEDAIAETEAKYGRYMKKIASNILSDGSDSEEAVSDACLAVWNRIPPERPMNLGAYLSRIVRNIAVDKYRHLTAEKRGGGEVALAIDELSDITSPSDTADTVTARETAAEISRFLRTLPERDADIFVLRYYYVYPMKTIAKRYGTSEGYVRTVLSRTRAKIKAHIKGDNDEKR